MFAPWIDQTAVGAAGDLTLAVAAGKPAFADLFDASTVAKNVGYALKGQASGKLEIGRGKLSFSDPDYVLARDLVTSTWVAGVGNRVDPSATDFTGETVSVWCWPELGHLYGHLPIQAWRASTSGVRGTWQLPGLGFSGGTSSAALPSAYRFYYPWENRSPGPVDTLWLYVTSADTATQFHAVVYEVDLATGNPGRVLLDFGACAFTGTGWKSVTIGTPKFIPAGPYYIAVQADAGSMTAAGAQFNFPPSFLSITSSGFPVTRLYRQPVYSSSAFPDETGNTFTEDYQTAVPGFVIGKA